MLGTVVGAGAGVVDATTESRGGPKGHDVYFIRHAEASPADGPLSVNGLAQAEALRVLLHDQRIASVDTSMLTRAFQTGAAVASDHDLRITADERINEVGFVAAAVPQIPTILSDWLNGRNRAEGYGGESFDQAAVRWQSWWHDYSRAHKDDRGTSVVVAHGALLLLMLPETCSNAIDPAFNLSHSLYNTAIIKATMAKNGKITCYEWAGAPVPSATAPR